MKSKNTIKKLKASTIFVLSAANNSKLQSNGTVKFIFVPDVTERRISNNIKFKLTFHVSNTKYNIQGTLFLEKYVESIKCSFYRLEVKNDTKSLKFYDSSIKLYRGYSQFFPVFVDHSLYFQLFVHRILTYLPTAYECKNKYAKGTISYKSDFSFLPLRRNVEICFWISICIGYQ